jgi:RimJ/RimL family protein N-acetyltransferase
MGEKHMNNIKYYDVFLKGEIVDLVCLNEEVIEKSDWYNWFNDEENMKHMQKHYFPNTKAKQLQFYKTEIEDNPAKLQLGIYHKKDNLLVGVISLNNIDFLNGKCEISGFIGEKKYQNLKLFMEANKLLIKHAFENLNMHRIEGGTLIKEVLLMYCKILGFREEGIRRSAVYKNGRHNDAYLVGLLREEYYAKFQKNA